MPHNGASYSSEYLLSEAARLLAQLDRGTDPQETAKLEGCLKAIQETVLEMGKNENGNSH